MKGNLMTTTRRWSFGLLVVSVAAAAVAVVWMVAPGTYP